MVNGMLKVVNREKNELYVISKKHPTARNDKM